MLYLKNCGHEVSYRFSKIWLFSREKTHIFARAYRATQRLQRFFEFSIGKSRIFWTRRNLLCWQAGWPGKMVKVRWKRLFQWEMSIWKKLPLLKNCVKKVVTWWRHNLVIKSLLEILNILAPFTKRLSTRPGVDHCSILKTVVTKWVTKWVQKSVKMSPLYFFHQSIHVRGWQAKSQDYRVHMGGVKSLNCDNFWLE